ncbi:MAG: transporter ATP-binding protein [Rhodospirillales bacterium]|nr:transporter ATP-binding protein [Rhodospirillales bacterium]
MSLLDVDDLRVRFASDEGDLNAVNGLSFNVEAGETLAIVGESGSGKSVTAMSVLRLLKCPPARISGRVRFKGKDLLTLPESEMRRIRGNQIGMIFQEPMSSLNPVMAVGAQIAESVRLHQGASRAQARSRALDLLSRVGIPAPGRRMREYPHQLSGGMRQRVMIAIALACNPELLIADEPTTALDVTVQAQILDLMRALKAELGSAIILISHDLGVVAQIADRVIIMYAGRIVEQGTMKRILSAPMHPYTRGLLGAIPHLSAAHRCDGPRRRLVEIPGAVPTLRERIAGCAFAPRCAHCTQICQAILPPMVVTSAGHEVACHHAEARTAA